MIFKHLALIGASLFLIGSAHADGLSFDLKSVVSGKSYPAIILKPAVAVKKVTITLTRGDGKVITLKASRLKPGRNKTLTVKQGDGQFHYKGHFEVIWADSSRKPTKFDTEFSLTKIGKLRVNITSKDVDLDARTLKCTSNNPIQKVELLIHGERGRILDRIEKSHESADPGTIFELAWTASDEKVLYMDLRLTDIVGFWSSVRITPFSISIPHDEVVFASGHHAIRASEAPKLQKTLGLIQVALRKHGTLLTLKLYVAGYTDTVGSRGSNQELSTRRARSIAAWFRKNGLKKVPIYYQGFGEDVLAKSTPDEFEEAANRRALYLLASQSPGMTKQTPRSRWHRL